jgi:hypothetical protein
MVQQGIHQRACPVTRSRMNYHPGGLVDHNDLVVLMNDVEWDVLRQEMKLLRIRYDGLDLVTLNRPVRSPHLRAVDGYMAIGNQLLNAIARYITDLCLKIEVYPPIIIVRLNDKRVLLQDTISRLNSSLNYNRRTRKSKGNSMFSRTRKPCPRSLSEDPSMPDPQPKVGERDIFLTRPGCVAAIVQ